jgi:hypothetical protein
MPAPVSSVAVTGAKAVSAARPSRWRRSQWVVRLKVPVRLPSAGTREVRPRAQSSTEDQTGDEPWTQSVHGQRPDVLRPEYESWCSDLSARAAGS